LYVFAYIEVLILHRLLELLRRIEDGESRDFVVVSGE